MTLIHRSITRITTAALSVTLLTALVACGSATPESDNSGDTTATTAPTTSSTPSTQPSDTPEGKKNGIDEMTGPQAIGQVLAALHKTDAVHLTGSYTTPISKDEQGRPLKNATTTTVTIDTSGTENTYTSTILMNNVTTQLLRKGNDIYLRGNAKLAAGMEIPALKSRWVRFDKDDTRVTHWQELASPRKILDGILATDEPGVVFAVGVTMKSNSGQPAVQLLVNESNQLAGTVLVATTGKPLPFRIALADKSGVVDLNFDGWGSTFSVQTPKPSETTKAPQATTKPPRPSATAHATPTADV